MDIMQLFWLFFIISALQPVLQRRYLEAMRTRKIAQIEKKRSSRVILLIHRQETMNLLGFPLMRSLERRGVLRRGSGAPANRVRS